MLGVSGVEARRVERGQEIHQFLVDAVPRRGRRRREAMLGMIERGDAVEGQIVVLVRFAPARLGPLGQHELRVREQRVEHLERMRGERIADRIEEHHVLDREMLVGDRAMVVGVEPPQLDQRRGQRGRPGLGQPDADDAGFAQELGQVGPPAPRDDREARVEPRLGGDAVERAEEAVAAAQREQQCHRQIRLLRRRAVEIVDAREQRGVDRPRFRALEEHRRPPGGALGELHARHARRRALQRRARERRVGEHGGDPDQRQQLRRGKLSARERAQFGAERVALGVGRAPPAEQQPLAPEPLGREIAVVGVRGDPPPDRLDRRGEVARLRMEPREPQPNPRVAAHLREQRLGQPGGSREILRRDRTLDPRAKRRRCVVARHAQRASCALTRSAAAITRSTLPPASFATSASGQPRRISSASSAG